MTVEKTDIQKIEALLSLATNERQRNMYRALLKKAQAQVVPTTAPNPPKKTKSSTKAKKKDAAPNQNGRGKSVNKKTAENDTAPSADHKKETKAGTQSETSAATPSQEHSPPHFSGVGIIRCTPFLKDERIYITINELNDTEYRLEKPIGKFRRRPFDHLRAELQAHGPKEMLLRVYPHVWYVREDGNPTSHVFQLVHYYMDETKQAELAEEFTLCGIWQVMTHCPMPVITIYRNFDQYPFYQKMPGDVKKYFAKPQYIPVVWENPPVAPYEYYDKPKPSDQRPRYFVQVTATFQGDHYLVKEMLAEPTLEIPRFIKRSKKKHHKKPPKKD